MPILRNICLLTFLLLIGCNDKKSQTNSSLRKGMNDNDVDFVADDFDNVKGMTYKANSIYVENSLVQLGNNEKLAKGEYQPYEIKDKLRLKKMSQWLELNKDLFPELELMGSILPEVVIIDSNSRAWPLTTVLDSTGAKTQFTLRDIKNFLTLLEVAGYKNGKN